MYFPYLSPFGQACRWPATKRVSPRLCSLLLSSAYRGGIPWGLLAITATSAAWLDHNLPPLIPSFHSFPSTMHSPPQMVFLSSFRLHHKPCILNASMSLRLAPSKETCERATEAPICAGYCPFAVIRRRLHVRYNTSSKSCVLRLASCAKAKSPRGINMATYLA